MRDLLVVVLWIIVTISTLIFIAFIYSATIGKHACYNFGKGMKLEVVHDTYYGCIVTLPDGSHLPKEIYEENLKFSNQNLNIKGI